MLLSTVAAAPAGLHFTKIYESVLANLWASFNSDSNYSDSCLTDMETVAGAHDDIVILNGISLDPWRNLVVYSKMPDNP